MAKIKIEKVIECDDISEDDFNKTAKKAITTVMIIWFFCFGIKISAVAGLLYLIKYLFF